LKIRVLQPSERTTKNKSSNQRRGGGEAHTRSLTRRHDHDDKVVVVALELEGMSVAARRQISRRRGTGRIQRAGGGRCL
jgi:hypothetical protein